MNALLNVLKNNKKFESYLKEIQDFTSPISLLGLSDVAKIYFAYQVKEETKRPICIVTYNELQAKKMVKDLTYFTDKIYFFPKKEIVTYDYLAESKQLPYERIDCLNAIQENKADVIITTIEAVMQELVPKDVLLKKVLEFEEAKEYSLEEIKQTLIEIGYQRTDLIEGRGQFSTRGGIVDIAITNQKGVRIEFWGDQVDSIRYFDITTQRSTKNITQIKIYPAHEYILEEPIANTILKIEEKYGTDNTSVDIEQIQNLEYISKIDKYLHCFYSKTVSFLDYLPKDVILFLDEKTKIEARIRNIQKDNDLLIQTLIDKKKQIPEAVKAIFKAEEMQEIWETKQHIFLEQQDIQSSLPNSYHFSYREVNYTKASIQAMLDEIKKAIQEKKAVVLLSGNQKNSNKIISLLEENNIKHVYDENLQIIKREIVTVSNGIFSTGFESYEDDLLVITGEELFSTDNKKRKQVSSEFRKAQKVVYADLKIGDYIVHKTNGIGQFIGVNTLKADGITKDYMKIKYQGDDILYVPTNALDNIRKYVGGGEALPKLNKLGSKEWTNTKAKVKNNLREVARNLIELYAKRQKQKGYAFSKDTPWQKQFEDAFVYTETQDQLRCIQEVKQDMEQEKPMDRLLCGDVGYGKTEVAIRAAFKACMDQKQVAYLVPTTVLATQQYESFKERMENFAVKVELLNRFRTKKEQEEIIRKLKLGEIDVVIGTHRLLSKDVEFKDLGLLIIDEEHRFGVKDKEKIKEIKTTVDVLTMTATPIPRTLHMSILGVRDMSVIYDPPQDRKMVQTYVLEYDSEIIREAITKELERNGQVFYLYNNVEHIVKKAEEVSHLLPEAKIAFAHGQMSGAELEAIMMEFIKGKIDVLVCTTILESGIDIPNANTIIVENADRLGLAQLYQIRGRVGRSNIQSYAYITYKRDKLLSEVSNKRLNAIKEFTEFGSGFKIAMRDLEIRGAGSILGEIQHGHMEQVGYDTYCRLLDEVVKEMQGVEVKEEIDVQIELNVSSYIPSEYIENESQKIEIYQDIALCRTEEDLQEVMDEMIDRYGNMPKEVENLIEIARVKALCKQAGITKISQKMQNIVFHFDPQLFHYEIIDNLMKKYRNQVKFSPGTQPYLTYRLEIVSEQKILQGTRGFLTQINEVEKCK